jgi:glucose-6-phosphate 1-dehydrogenase
MSRRLSASTITYYLGNETVENLLVIRFANSIVEPICNHKPIEPVQISVSEDVVRNARINV